MEDQGPGPDTEGGSSAEDRFWERYRLLVVKAGVEEGVAVWYRRHVEGFIRFLKPRRLREAGPGDVAEFLVRMRRRKDTSSWHVRQADKALRLLPGESCCVRAGVGLDAEPGFERLGLLFSGGA
jgi:hypothetical protein